MSRRLAVLLGVGVAVLVVAGWATLGHGRTSAPVGHSGGSLGPSTSPLPASLMSRLDVASDRMQKTDLIQRLTAPPEVVILGGSRALRFEPAYIHERTGLTGFNAAVTCARPEDAWAFVNLLHARFPGARFRFLWVIHADEFDRKPLDPGLVNDPALARFFPPALITPGAVPATASASAAGDVAVITETP